MPAALIMGIACGLIIIIIHLIEIRRIANESSLKIKNILKEMGQQATPEQLDRSCYNCAFYNYELDKDNPSCFQERIAVNSCCEHHKSKSEQKETMNICYTAIFAIALLVFNNDVDTLAQFSKQYIEDHPEINDKLKKELMGFIQTAKTIDEL